MENDKQHILQRVGGRDGMTVPDGYFADFQQRMESLLPPNDAAEKPQTLHTPRSMWQRMRPFVYMAAMFAGVWCMVKMFTLMSTNSVDLSIDNNEILTSALADDNFVYEYLRDDVSAREMFEEMYNDNIDFDDMPPADSLEEWGMDEYIDHIDQVNHIEDVEL